MSEQTMRNAGFEAGPEATIPGNGNSGRTPGDGSRIWHHPTLDVVHIRPGNQIVRDIPADQRLLEIGCYDGGSRRGGRHMVAVVDSSMKVHTRNHPNAQPNPGVLRVLCRCPAGQHDLDMAKLWAAADRARQQLRPRKGRMVDLRSVTLETKA